MKHIAAILKQATQAQITAGKAWYNAAYAFAESLAAKHNISTLTAAGVIAALSPNNKWSRNLIDSEALIDAHLAGRELPKVCTFNSNKLKAVAILDAVADVAVISAILSGQKIIAFFRSIVNLDGVCIDGHAYSIWAGKRIVLQSVPKMTPTVFAHIQKHYRAVAKRAESICGQALTPTELQAVTWVTYRDLYAIKG